MLKRIAFAAGVAGIVAFAASAGADPLLTFNLDKAYLTVTPDTADSATIDVFDDNSILRSEFEMYLEDPDLEPIIRDALTFSDVDKYSFLLSISLQKVSVGNWKTTDGTLSVVDITGNTKVWAKFVSTEVNYGEGGNYALEVKGNLYTDVDNGYDSVLVGTGNDWVFVGDEQLLGYDYGDGEDYQITVPCCRDSWDNGTVVTVRVGGLNPETIEDFLAIQETYPGCQVNGQIVPVPAAFGLGLVGLGIVGYWMRRFA